ncbi:Phospholipase D [Quillaja saponaria]|uniref:Phospholipase D n=1 Tax=Quillaja saponaria TaxID=32244 RepID=A0AAD7LZ77_QUISA|nr:Phospholipase D [Quillaja saponaria]
MAGDKSDTVVYLHGDLELKIMEAKSFPYMDLVSERFRRFFTAFNTCRVPFSKKKKHHSHRKIITSDPYATGFLAGATVALSQVEFYVKDNDVFGADLIGIASVSAQRILSGETINDWFLIIGSSGKPPKPDSVIRLKMTFTRCEDKPVYRYGIAADPNQFGLRNCYFPVRKGGSITLYQDAHVPDSMVPKIELDNGNVFQHDKEPTKPLPSGGNLNLGKLLKYKSQEGVRVLLLVWDDKTSHSKFFLNTTGVMQTHDEETQKFFKHSSVSCVLSPRYASSKLSIFRQQVVGTLFTHHQKCVIVDTQAPGNNRKITSFIGGLDFCDGRYDTPQHRLFRDFGTIYQNDYHNPTFSAGTKGPRQPWHDLHCLIEGPAAYDVLTNFEQCWKKATKWSELGQRFKGVSRWHDDSLMKLDRISWILSPSPSTPDGHPALCVSKEDDPENWHVLVFRSIDSGSLKGFPKDVYQAKAQNIVCAKNLVIDKSIQTAYIQAIRSAQHFIYIENQYFLGSFARPSYKEAGADNLIPMELALKIVSKIRAKERFAVYVVIDMWSEGVPSSASVQGILFWQTMQMMYETIAWELKAMKIEGAHPQDYLNFCCLGNRKELPKEGLASSNLPSHSGDTVSASQKFQPSMIYVHAKGMIKKGHPHGQVYGYSMSLWAEHLGLLDSCFKEPESMTCVKTVNKIAEDNWKKYTEDSFTPLQGHLLKYPLLVESNGKVWPLPGEETFPDVGGKVLGSRNTLPDALTT